MILRSRRYASELRPKPRSRSCPRSCSRSPCSCLRSRFGVETTKGSESKAGTGVGAVTSGEEEEGAFADAGGGGGVIER